MQLISDSMTERTLNVGLFAKSFNGFFIEFLNGETVSFTSSTLPTRIEIESERTQGIELFHTKSCLLSRLNELASLEVLVEE